MNEKVTVTSRRGGTMGVVVARVSDPENAVAQVNFFLQVLDGDSLELGPYPPDIVRRPQAGNGRYEKDIVLDPLYETAVRTELVREDGSRVPDVPVQTLGLRDVVTPGGEARRKGEFVLFVDPAAEFERSFRFFRNQRTRDFQGYTARVQWRNAETDALLLDFTEANGRLVLRKNQGVIGIRAPSATMGALTWPNKVLWDVLLTDAAGEHHRPIRGQVKPIRNITR